VYIASYGHREAICKHLQIAGWNVPPARIVTPGIFPDHNDGNDMKDDKATMLKHIAELHPGIPLLLVDDSPSNVKQARADGRAAIKVHRRRGIDSRCLLKITQHCAQQAVVLVLDYDLTLTTRHVTSEVCNPYVHRNGHLDGIENKLTIDFFVDAEILKALLPTSWRADTPCSPVESALTLAPFQSPRTRSDAAAAPSRVLPFLLDSRSG
jgi:hypothetical protein